MYIVYYYIELLTTTTSFLIYTPICIKERNIALLVPKQSEVNLKPLLTLIFLIDPE